MIIESLASAIAAMSFGVIFNIKGNRLIAAGGGGFIAWLVYLITLENNFPETSAYFISAMCFSVYCEICARICKTPATTLSVCCLIPLVPGYGVYNTMYSFIVGDYIQAIEFAVETLSLAGALALGVIFISSIFRKFHIHKVFNNVGYKVKETYEN